MAGEFIGSNLTFTNLPVTVSRDASITLTLYGTLKSRDSGAEYLENFGVLLDTGSAMQWSSQTDGQVFTPADFGADFSVTKNQVGNQTVRWSGLKVAKTWGAADVYRDNASEVLKFSFTAEPEGAIRIRKFRFKLSPKDYGNDGPNNDSLEAWANLNGDFADDDEVANLWWGSGYDRTLMCEDYNGKIRYSVVDGGVQISDPVASGYQSASGDYALLEYDFEAGSEWFIPAGATHEFTMDLDTAVLVQGSNQQLTIDLPGDISIHWTDIPSGNYTALSGPNASGWPITTTLTVRE